MEKLSIISQWLSISYEGYIGFTSGNTNHILNDIDILSLTITDHDPQSFYFKKEAGLVFEDNHAEYVFFPMGIPSTSGDILHTKHKVNKLQTSMKLIEFANQDNNEQILFKMWETLHIFNLNLSNLINTLRKFEEDRLKVLKQWIDENQLEFMSQNLIESRASLELINNAMRSLNDTVTFLSTQVEDIKSELTREEMDITNNLIKMIKGINQKLDGLQSKMQAHESYSQLLITKYNKQGNQLMSDMSNIMVNALNIQSQEIGQKISNENSYWFYIFIILLIFGITYLMKRKIQQDSKQHIL